MEMGWKLINVDFGFLGDYVVILCRMEMGWKTEASGFIAPTDDVVILCRMEMGWKKFPRLTALFIILS